MMKNIALFSFKKRKKGFTLVEAVIALGVFSLMMGILGQTFGSLFRNYQTARSLQQNIESAQFALNLMAKELRTSSLNGGSNQNRVIFFDYSQNRCLRYSFGLNTLERSISSQNADDCKGNGGFVANTTGAAVNNVVVSRSGFRVDRSNAGNTVGKVTVVLEVTDGNRSGTTAKIQTTVSLRDYLESGVVVTP